MRNVAVCLEKHSQMLGHLASWQTVCKWQLSISARTFSKPGPEGKRRFSHAGFFGTWCDMISPVILALRASFLAAYDGRLSSTMNDTK
jgi:hypothetical protein